MSARAPTPARGFSLVELLVAVTLLAVVLGAVVSLAVSQQRAYSALAARRDARRQLRDAALLLARDLRPLVPAIPGDPGDVREASDTLLDLVVTTGGSLTCAVSPPSTIELPPTEPPESAATWWVAVPRAGDLARVLDLGVAPDESDDRWVDITVASVATSTGACAGSPLAGDARGGYRVSLAGTLPTTVGVGTPVTFARRRRWSHYRGSDALWYLGLREWDGAAWGETQPAAGPFRRAGGTAPGMSVVALDSGAFGVALRADPAVPWRAGRWPVVAESARALVALRGATRGLP